MKDVLRFMDIFLVEGCKAIFRMAFSLVQLVRYNLKVSLIAHVLIFVTIFHAFLNHTYIDIYHAKVSASDRLRVVLE